MIPSSSAGIVAVQIVLAVVCTLLGLPLLSSQTEADPWNAAQTVQPSELLKELNGAKDSPIVLFVGFKRLYTAGHIQGAQYHGTGGSPEGLKEITAWADSLPRTSNLVIYCGCCPMERCPNIRPAYKQLASMGFTKLRLLILPNSFAQDWADKGYAYDKSQ
jgi:hypothetical protein